MLLLFSLLVLFVALDAVVICCLFVCDDVGVISVMVMVLI